MKRRVNRTAKGWIRFDDWIFNKLGVSSGDQILDNKKLYRQYLLAVKKEANKYGYNKRRSIPEKVIYELRADVFDALRKAFKDLGLTDRW
jgi:hypothetical protein